MKGFFHFDESTRGGSLFLNGFFCDVDPLDENALLLEENGDDFALFAFVLSGDYLYEISAVNFHMGNI